MRLRLLVVALVLGIVGCGPDTGRRDLQGAVTFRGQPVPRGVILFDPPADGPGTQGSAEIVDGRYRTLSEFGPLAGEYSARITGYDGKVADNAPEGAMLFDSAVPVVVPEQGGTLDIVVPEPPAKPAKQK